MIGRTYSPNSGKPERRAIAVERPSLRGRGGDLEGRDLGGVDQALTGAAVGEFVGHRGGDSAQGAYRQDGDRVTWHEPTIRVPGVSTPNGWSAKRPGGSSAGRPGGRPAGPVTRCGR